MLLDLLYSALPSRKKRRWHYNTFMLDIFRRLEQERILRSGVQGMALEHEHYVLSLAKDTVGTSPILFLDEFQMPDRAASKLINSFMTAFFHLGGVLVASSNRMPDELAKASGVEFGSRAQDKGMFGWAGRRSSPGEEGAKSDFGLFLEVLKARCDIWEIEGERDWRREGDDFEDREMVDAVADIEEFVSGGGQASVATSSAAASETLSSDTPRHYHISLSSDPTQDPSLTADLETLNPSQTWLPTTLTVYSRALVITTTNPTLGLALCSFPSLCATNLGPADYISLCSTFHTLILTDVPVLTLLQKNEARRFITLLDALYEARCRLLISAAAPPDKLFFPETRSSRAHGLLETNTPSRDSDSIDSEAFSEMYQDSTAPFRPNISMYNEHRKDTSAAPTFSLRNNQLRSVLADEDVDFGPTYGNGRSHGTSIASSADELRELEERQMHAQNIGPDFTNVGVLTGEDERFAYKRARSRLWEMCGSKWWKARPADRLEEWWTPVAREGEGRFWESLLASRGPALAHAASVCVSNKATEATQPGVMPDSSHDGGRRRSNPDVQDAYRQEGLFKHGASPYRIVDEPPPKFGWQHAWGMVTWGKKAGEWGKGVEGRRSRGAEPEGGTSADGVESGKSRDP
jgi:peroxisome-assembly ATPase